MNTLQSSQMARVRPFFIVILVIIATGVSCATECSGSGCILCGFTGSTFCYDCSEKYYLDTDSVCQACNTTCKSCDTKNVCTTCRDDFKRTDEGYCLKKIELLFGYSVTDKSIPILGLISGIIIFYICSCIGCCIRFCYRLCLYSSHVAPTPPRPHILQNPPNIGLYPIDQPPHQQPNPSVFPPLFPQRQAAIKVDNLHAEGTAVNEPQGMYSSMQARIQDPESSVLLNEILQQGPLN